MNIEKIVHQIKMDEGFSSTPYWDNKQWTWGYGTKAPGPHGSITKEAAELELRKFVMVAVSEFRDIFKGVPICGTRANALVNMLYNLGGPTFRGFKKMIAAIKDENWELAAKEVRNSRWYYQTGNRGERIANELEEG